MIDIIIIVCLVIIFYIRTLEYSLIVDDIRHYTKISNGSYRWRDISKVNGFQNKIKIIFYRTRDRWYGAGTLGLNTIWDHALTTAMHALTCVLIYLVFGANQISFWASVLYALNPTNDQVAIWLNGRRYQMVIILSLMALLFKPWGVLFYLITPMFQFTAFFLPVLYWDVSPLFCLIPLLIYLYSRKRVHREVKGRMARIHNKDQREWSAKRIIVVIKTYGLYFFKMVFPQIPMFVYKDLMSWGVTEAGNKDAYSFNRDFFLGLLALSLTGVIIYYTGAIGLFMFLATLQWCAIIPAFQQYSHRYITLVNVFMMYIVSLFLNSSPYGWAFCLALAVHYATRLDICMLQYRSITDFYEYQMFFDPKQPRNRVIYADSYLQVQDVTTAWIIVKEGLRHCPDDFELLFKGAVCAANVGLMDKADEFLNRAEKNYYLGQEELQKNKIDMLRMRIAEVIHKHQESRQVRRANERKARKMK